jgi:hypothetical protein
MHDTIGESCFLFCDVDSDHTCGIGAWWPTCCPKFVKNVDGINHYDFIEDYVFQQTGKNDSSPECREARMAADRNMSEMCSMHLNKMTAMILDFIVYLSQQKDIEKIVDELREVDRAVFLELVVNAMEKNPSHTSIYCAEQLWDIAPLTSLALLDWLNDFNEFYA